MAMTVTVISDNCICVRCTGGGEESRRRTDTDGEHHKGKPTDAGGTRQTGRF